MTCVMWLFSYFRGFFSSVPPVSQLCVYNFHVLQVIGRELMFRFKCVSGIGFFCMKHLNFSPEA